MGIATESSPFNGRTSQLPWRLPIEPLACRRCGSSLFGRRQGIREAGRNGATHIVEVFRCRCGAGRHVHRELG